MTGIKEKQGDKQQKVTDESIKDPALDIDISSTYKEILPQLKSYLYRLICDMEITHDLAQDTFLKVMLKKDQFKGESSLKSWIFSIATNLAFDWLRKRKRWEENAQDKARDLARSVPEYRQRYLGIHQSSSSGGFDFREHINFCFTCLSKVLPVEQQVSMILKDIYDFRISEISVILKSPAGTIKHWLFLARQTMRSIFERRCALVNKHGVCHQCSELNGLFNPKQKIQEDILINNNRKENTDFCKLRTQLIKGIDPLNAPGSVLEDAIMQTLRAAINDI